MDLIEKDIKEQLTNEVETNYILDTEQNIMYSLDRNGNLRKRPFAPVPASPKPKHVKKNFWKNLFR